VTTLFNLALAVIAKIQRQEGAWDREETLSAAHKCLERDDWNICNKCR